MPMNSHPTSIGVFKPMGHVLMSFATAADSDAAVGVLRDAGFGESEISRDTPSEMRDQAELDIGKAGGLASLGQDLNLAKTHLALAEQGRSFVVVSAHQTADSPDLGLDLQASTRDGVLGPEVDA